MQTFPTCHSRVNFDKERSLFFCAHPSVHTVDNLVFPTICQNCTRRLEPEPIEKREVSANLNNPLRFTSSLTDIAVIIPCHNYGRYLREAIESVLNQTKVAKEILVVDDNSTDDSRTIAESFSSSGVRLITINALNVHDARRVGFEATTSPVLCFLDADDRLPPNYLECGLRQLRLNPDAGIVHSDLQCFGTKDELISFPNHVDRVTLSARNRIHAGSLVRRDAILLSKAFETKLPGEISRLTGDWFIWKCILGDGWKSIKQSSAYLYRRHEKSALHETKIGNDYFRVSHIDRETITLFIPLSGRHVLWPQMQEFLEGQTWPHQQIQLMILDTSGDAEFAGVIKNWVAGCDYPDVRHICKSVGEPGLADFPRAEVVNAVRRTMARIYNFLARSVQSSFVWVLEDDINPPLDVCEQLLREFDATTGSVSAPYRSRYHDGFVAWDHFGRKVVQDGNAVQTIGGNGFGCVLIRGELLSERVFSGSPPNADFDHDFYANLRCSNWKAKIHWGVEAKHLSDTERQILFSNAPLAKVQPT
jgi:Glycosyl transferase family 2